MENMHLSIVINAPREKVWDVMMGESTYPLWTEVFMPGSYFVGDWNEGSKILFLAPDESGGMSGMLSRIKENKPYESISIEMVGIVHNGKEDTSSQEARDWAGSHENYTFKNLDGKTELQVDLTTNMDTEEYQEMFEKTWPRALKILKKLAEQA